MTFFVTVAGDSTPVEVYGGMPAALHYLLYRAGDGPAAWRALTNPDDQARALVSATLFLDAQAWQGLPTVPAVSGTTLQWPRTGVVDANGLAVDPTTVPIAIVNACFELAAMIADDPDFLSAADNGTNTKEVHGGPAGVEYFVPTSAANGTATLLPTIVQRLVGQYLGSSASTVGGGVSTGTGERPQLGRERFRRSWPL